MHVKAPECEGCKIHLGHCVIDPTFIDKDKTYVCPCQNCLLKGNCSEYCSEFINYVKKYYEYIGKDIKLNLAHSRRIESLPGQFSRYNMTYIFRCKDLYLRNNNLYVKHKEDSTYESNNS